MSQKQYLTWNNPFAACEKWLRREENGFYHILENLESRKKRKSSAARSTILHLYSLERVLQATQIIFNKFNALGWIIKFLWKSRSSKYVLYMNR